MTAIKPILPGHCSHCDTHYMQAGYTDVYIELDDGRSTRVSVCKRCAAAPPDKRNSIARIAFERSKAFELMHATTDSEIDFIKGQYFKQITT